MYAFSLTKINRYLGGSAHVPKNESSPGNPRGTELVRAGDNAIKHSCWEAQGNLLDCYVAMAMI